MLRQATIRDVAAAANVHASTVSRILSAPSREATPTRERVLAAATELGYRPNLLARALSANSAPIVPLLVPDVANWFFAEVARGAEDAARAAGYSLVLCNTEGEQQREREYLESLVALRVPFAIVAPNAETSGQALRTFASQCPVVAIDRLVDGLPLPSVTVDNHLGGRLATEHLLDLGHRAVACIAGPDGASTARERLRGYGETMDAAGAERIVIEGGFTTDDGLRAARLFAELPARPTAVVAANDLCAIAFIHEAERLGVRVPGDVSVVGFDDLVFASYWRPTLTSVHQPARELGSLAIEVALRSVRLGRDTHLSLEPRLVVRDSTGPVP